MSSRAVVLGFGVFATLSLVCTVVMVSTLVNPVAGPSTTYRAVLSDATGLVAGSDVRIAGIRVGRVGGVELGENNDAVVSFDVEAEHRIPSDGRVVVRYADMLGSRALTLEPGDAGTTPTSFLAPGATIPLERTTPALDLTGVLGGFRPLFDALDPEQTNELATSLVQVVQGEGATVESVLRRTIEVASTLAAKNQVIDRMLVDLGGVLDEFARNRPDFAQMITSLDEFVAGLAQDRDDIGAALDSAGGLAAELAGLTDRLEPVLAPAGDSVSAASRPLVDPREPIAQGVSAFDELFAALGAAASYGSWVNVYICNLSFDLVGHSLSLEGPERSAVCR